MARKKPGTAPTEKRFSVKGYELHARPMVTIGPDHVYWDVKREIPDDLVRSAFVRVQPPEGMLSLHLNDVRTHLLKLGAAEVRILPCLPSGAVVTAKEHAKAAPVVSIRATVLDLANNANTKNREALLELVESTMGKVGL